MTASPAAPRPAPHSARCNHGVAATRWLAPGRFLAPDSPRPDRAWGAGPLRPGGCGLALNALALCLPLAGLLKNRMYAYRWVSLGVWFYFTEGVVRGWGDRPPSQWLGLGDAALCPGLFSPLAPPLPFPPPQDPRP